MKEYKTNVYVTSPESNQIHIFEMNKNGNLKLIQLIDTIYKAQPIIIHPQKKYIYTGIRPTNKIVCYHIDDNGCLIKNNEALLPGTPTYLTIDKNGKFLYCASYNNNCISVSYVNKQGIVSNPIQIIKNINTCHSTNINYLNSELWIPCTKENIIKIFNINNNGILIIDTLKIIHCKLNSGPRHMVFHKNNYYAYVVNEYNSTVSVIKIEKNNKIYNIIQTIDIIPRTISSKKWAADIHITPNNNWLYCCDRFANIISIFSISNNGSEINFIGYQETETQPRGFDIDKNGLFLIIAGQKSNNISVYSIEQKTGKLNYLKRYKVGKGPIWVLIK